MSAYDDAVAAANMIIDFFEHYPGTLTQVDTVGWYDGPNLISQGARLTSRSRLVSWMSSTVGRWRHPQACAMISEIAGKRGEHRLRAVAAHPCAPYAKACIWRADSRAAPSPSGEHERSAGRTARAASRHRTMSARTVHEGQRVGRLPRPHAGRQTNERARVRGLARAGSRRMGRSRRKRLAVERITGTVNRVRHDQWQTVAV